MTAALTGKVDAVKVLLAHGAQVNAQEPNKGQTALMWAASEGHTAAAEMLIEFGADIKAKSKGGFTPLLFAVRNGHKQTVQGFAGPRGQRQRCCSRRHQRPQYGGGERLFRSCRRSARSRREPQCPRRARLGAAHAGMASKTGLRWRQRPGTQILRSSAADWEHDVVGIGEGAARPWRQSQRSHRLAGKAIRQGRRHDAQSAFDHARPALPDLRGRHSLLPGGAQRRCALHAPARGTWRRSQNAQRAGDYSADRRLRIGLLGRRLPARLRA